jgi:hypothetical protein
MMWRLVARLGCFRARKSDGKPGVTTIRKSVQRVFDTAITI